MWASLLSTVAAGEALAQAPPEQVFQDAGNANAFVLSPDASGSVADRSSWRDDVGAGGMGAWGRLGHIAGETVGRTQSITHVELMPYMFAEDTMFFGDGRLYATNNGHLGGTGGFGLRHYLGNWNSIIGASAFYDRDDTRAKSFEQIGLSFEYLSEWLDVRTNLYQNIGRDQATLGTSLVQGSERFEGYRIAFDTTTRTAAATDGIDMLFTSPVPGEVAQSINMEASAGWYHFQARGLDLPKIWGYKLRLDADWMANVLHTFVEFTSDRVFDNNVVFGADVNVYPGVERRSRIGHNQFSRMSEWVRRNYNVVTIDDDVLNPTSLAINPETGQPYLVVHVRNIVPPNPEFPNFPNGDGTPEEPFQFIDEGQAAFVQDQYTNGPTQADIVFVHAGSVYANNPVVFQRDNLQILGEGVIHPIAVANAPFSRARPVDPLGTIRLPEVTGGDQVPILRDTLADAVVLQNNNVFAGFDIINTTGTAIVADDKTNGTIRDVNVNTTSGATSHGVHFTDIHGNWRLENVSISGTEGEAVFLDGGDAVLNWFGGTVTNSINHAVLIQNQTGGSLNLGGDNGTTPGTSFGGLTINDTGGEGILIQDTQADIVFGRSATTPTTQPGVTITNSQVQGVRILNLDQPGSVTFLRGLAIANPTLEALDIADSTGDFILLDDPGLVTDLQISGRNDAGIDLTNIDAPGRIVFIGDVDLGSVLINDTVDPPIFGTPRPAINFNDGSTGLVQFEGDLAIGPASSGGLFGASVFEAINIGGLLPNEEGARFEANGNVVINDSYFGPAISVTNDVTDVQFGRPNSASQVQIDPRFGSAITLLNNTGDIIFNSAVTVADVTDPGSITVNIQDNEGRVAFSSLFVTDSLGPDPVVLAQNNRNAAGTAQVSFGSLNINADSGLAFQGVENDSLTVSSGTIVSTNGPAIDLVNNDTLSATFTSVTATDYAPFPFGIRVIDTRFAPNPNASFTIQGNSAAGSGGLISSGIILGDGIASRGVIIQNIQTANLRLQDYVDNDGIAVDVLNVPTFNLIGVIDVRGTLGISQMTNNGTDEIEGNVHHVRALANVLRDGTQGYDWNMSGFAITEGALVTNDAALHFEGLAGARGSNLDLTVFNGLNQDLQDFFTGYITSRGNTDGAVIRVDWNGNLDAAFIQNTISYGGDDSGTNIIDITQSGTAFENNVSFDHNIINQTAILALDTTGVRMRFDGQTDLNVAAFYNLRSPFTPPLPGMTFSGLTSTGFDMVFRTAGNNIVFDRNMMDFNFDGSTGILFNQIAASNVTIGVANMPNLPVSNSIELSDILGLPERGIIFQSSTGLINLNSTADNAVFLNPNNGGAFIDFQPPANSTGQILINGVLRP